METYRYLCSHECLCILIPDDGGSTHLWNVGRQLFYTAVHPRRQFWTSHSWEFLMYEIISRGIPACDIIGQSASTWGCPPWWRRTPSQHMTVLCLRRLVAGISARRPRFAPESAHMGLVVEREAMGHSIFLWVLRFFLVNIIPPWLHTHISPGGKAIGPLVTAVQRHCLTPSTWITWKADT
jgi:hypothetical protein